MGQGSSRRRTPSPPPPPPPPPPTEPAPSSPSPTESPEKSPPRPEKPSPPFVFPETQSSVLPDPSKFFAPHLLSNPLPTNCFFQNFVLNNGDQPEYIHPYLIRSSNYALTLCYPSHSNTPASTHQIFSHDLTITGLSRVEPGSHLITSFNDLSVTVEFPGRNLTFFLVRGCPFVTCNMNRKVEVSISTIHTILECSSQHNQTKYIIKLDNNQTWLLYASSPINLTHDTSTITSTACFSGVIRIALLPNSDPKSEAILHRFSTCYPISGEAVFTRPFSVEYKWEKKGWGNLLMLAHPLHLKLLSDTDCTVTVLEGLKYNSIDGALVGVVGDSWVLSNDPIAVTWHSVEGVNEESFPEIIDALNRDVEALDPKAIDTTSSYFQGKLIARAARLALIAEEVCYFDVIPAIRNFLKDTIEPWLDGNLEANGFLYDSKWGGLVTKQGSSDIGADSGFGIYNNHHYQVGYFVYAIAVLAKFDCAWGRKYKRQAYSLVGDYMNLGRRENSHYHRLRCFDLWKLHSWAGGLTEFSDGRNQESTSEAVNSYYSAALMGLVYGDPHLVTVGSTLSALEIQSAQTWWHVREDFYAEEFREENRLVGVLWANKRDSSLWFAPPEWRERRLGIHLLPLLPISEVLFSDLQFVKQLVQWTAPALAREGVEDGWKGFVYALEGLYDKEGSLEKIRALHGYDDGNSRTNLLWWIHSRDDLGEETDKARKLCWSRHYTH